MAMFCMTGQSEFDHTHFPYFYRLVPPDLEESYAMTVIARKLGYKRIALAFGNDIGSQTFIQPAVAALKKAGITLTTNQFAGPEGHHLPDRGGGGDPSSPTRTRS